ncbi:MAG: DNA polymerase III subunit gamma/tau [Clostridia bacterium]|nr:DNA polymerase III subunit gamma/tau [Clostridia bacterium]
MAHVSLYRRFRPDSFNKMVRQEHVVRVLQNQIQSGAVGHAYLFCGPRGTGKTSVARIFARAVNCESPKAGSPCGKCPTCRALSEGSLDVVEIDAASNNGVNEMRDLREKVQYPPVTGKYKVYIIDEVHMLTDSAYNALLKTLEEPPAHAIFILATTEPHKIPATILSRCMRLDFKLIPAEDLENHLKSILKEIGKEYEDEAVAAIARAGGGSDRDMLSIAETCIAYSDKLTYKAVTAALGTADFATTAKLVRCLLSADMPTAIFETENLLAEGKSVGVLVRDLLELLRQVAVVKTCSNAEKLLSLPKDLFQQVKTIADDADGRAILRATEILSKTENELRFASSPRIALESAVMRISMPEAEYDIDALLVRVSALEKRLAETPMPLQGFPVVECEVKPSKPAQRPKTVEEPLPEEPVYDIPEEPVYDAPFEAEPVKQETPKPAPIVGAEPMTAEVAFGKFIRMLRKTSKSGVLFTMCTDLSASYEGDKLILTTDIEAVFRSLAREEHRKVMEETFALVGVTDFEVRHAGSKKQSEANAVEELKKNFSEYPIEIK